MTWFAGLIFLVAAFLEVGGDAVTRTGLRGSHWLQVFCGFVMLGLYGIVVNTVRWDFARLLGVYVSVFAVVSVLVGAFYFHERIPTSTWMGISVIVLGGLIIQFGRS